MDINSINTIYYINEVKKIQNYKKPLKKLNWKKIIKKIFISWYHVIGIACCFGTAFCMTLAFYCFIVDGGVIFYDFNIIISIIEFISGIIAMAYSLFLLIKVFQNIK